MHNYVKPLVKSFKANANPANAEPMAKYMKNLFPYLGIKTPLRKELYRVFVKENGLPEITELKQIVLDLWDLPEREYQYVAIELIRKFSKKWNEDFIDLFETLIITKSWWDSVDGLASWMVGEHFRRFPHLRDQYIDRWMKSGNMWLQRTCLLFQLGYKDKTDEMLMGRVIMSLNGSKEFFINKAIGWILREYSKTDPEAVINFVNNNELANLSKREALKWLNNQGK
ncbi:MAG: DNA alkylation repair protein [Candidatus Cloacimonetes bacterium]|jgi:3-methyladenine DNA glycosylase AlkD|nr:DNA alkylation repair protein [Candidatus Cloacimonadota bacterium]MBT4332223.1 DNA alkylation repair protein [Candidatus Cloacimonadota bacterium]MBT4576226.1 DNA alkylation repair protein [Candidatus Cloacimonadota bacterium]MBT5419421.1 DNA alkylation repair protein [Candidatus Cloacimonadota bacterium]